MLSFFKTKQNKRLDPIGKVVIFYLVKNPCKIVKVEGIFEGILPQLHLSCILTGKFPYLDEKFSLSGIQTLVFIFMV